MNSHAHNIEIRTAGAEDAKLISVLATVSFYEAYFEQDTPHDLSNYIHDSFDVSKIEAEIAAPGTTFFIAYRDKKAVGYAKMREDSEVDGVDNETAIELQRIYTVERVFGTGIGARLLEHCFEFGRSKGCRSLWLGVWEENLRAQRFYSKYDFKRVGTITFPYGESVGINFVLEKML